MSIKEPFSQYVSRNEMSSFLWGTCFQCKETVVVGVVAKTQKAHRFNPQPVGGDEINRVYDRHFCKAVES